MIRTIYFSATLNTWPHAFASFSLWIVVKLPPTLEETLGSRNISLHISLHSGCFTPLQPLFFGGYFNHQPLRSDRTLNCELFGPCGAMRAWPHVESWLLWKRRLTWPVFIRKEIVHKISGMVVPWSFKHFFWLQYTIYTYYVHLCAFLFCTRTIIHTRTHTHTFVHQQHVSIGC